MNAVTRATMGGIAFRLLDDGTAVISTDEMRRVLELARLAVAHGDERALARMIALFALPTRPGFSWPPKAGEPS